MSKDERVSNFTNAGGKKWRTESIELNNGGKEKSIAAPKEGDTNAFEKDTGSGLTGGHEMGSPKRKGRTESRKRRRSVNYRTDRGQEKAENKRRARSQRKLGIDIIRKPRVQFEKCCRISRNGESLQKRNLQKQGRSVRLWWGHEVQRERAGGESRRKTTYRKKKKKKTRGHREKNGKEESVREERGSQELGNQERGGAKRGQAVSNKFHLLQGNPA